MSVYEEEFICMENNASNDTEFLHLWNQNVIPWTKKRGDEYKRVAHAYAEKKGFKFGLEAHRYVPSWETRELRDKILTKAAWWNGNLIIMLNGSKYSYHGVPHELFVNLCATWSPMSIYSRQIKGKYA